MAQLTSWLKYSGARKVDGTVVASGSAYFYRPGTTSTQVTVYADEDGLTALSQPVTLDAAGRATVYTTAPCRIEIQDSAGTVVAVEDRSNTIASGNVEVEIDGFSGTNPSTGVVEDGGRTTLTAALESVLGSIESLGDETGEVVPTDSTYGAIGDGTADDTTAIQAALTAAIAAGKRIRFPAGTYLISSALTISTKGLIMYGSGADDVIIKQSSTTANGLTIDLGSAIDSKISIRDISFTCSTSSSGTAISVANGDRIRIEGVHTLLYRNGIDVSAVSGAILRDCVVESNDGNAAVISLNLGARCRATDCEVISSTDVGTGIKLTGTDARATDCYITNHATAVNMAAARGVVRGTHINGPTTGISLAAANSIANDCYVTGTTTGFSVTGVASCRVTNCVGASNTTDLSVNASATKFIDYGNSFTTVSNIDGATQAPFYNRRLVAASTSSTASTTYTPDLSGGARFFTLDLQSGVTTLAVSAPATTNLPDGEEFTLIIGNNTGGAISNTINFDNFYSPFSSNAMNIATDLANGTCWRFDFRLDRSATFNVWRVMSRGDLVPLVR
jgi:hypothetical protein